MVYTVPNWIQGCSAIDHLLLSTLECFYSDSDCSRVLMIYIRKTFVGGITQPSWFDVRPLVYDPMLSRFPPKTSIKMIVKNIMIEQWNPSYSYS
ncbi:unnamed protein product, partial [Rotaria sp. Silwood2]